jgi:hypothetical protein
MQVRTDRRRAWRGAICTDVPPSWVFGVLRDVRVLVELIIASYEMLGEETPTACWWI